MVQESGSMPSMAGEGNYASPYTSKDNPLDDLGLTLLLESQAYEGFLDEDPSSIGGDGTASYEDAEHGKDHGNGTAETLQSGDSYARLEDGVYSLNEGEVESMVQSPLLSSSLYQSSSLKTSTRDNSSSFPSTTSSHPSTSSHPNLSLATPLDSTAGSVTIPSQIASRPCSFGLPSPVPSTHSPSEFPLELPCKDLSRAQSKTRKENKSSSTSISTAYFKKDTTLDKEWRRVTTSERATTLLALANLNRISPYHPAKVPQPPLRYLPSNPVLHTIKTTAVIVSAMERSQNIQQQLNSATRERDFYHRFFERRDHAYFQSLQSSNERLTREAEYFKSQLKKLDETVKQNLQYMHEQVVHWQGQADVWKNAYLKLQASMRTLTPTNLTTPPLVLGSQVELNNESFQSISSNDGTGTGSGTDSGVTTGTGIIPSNASPGLPFQAPVRRPSVPGNSNPEQIQQNPIRLQNRGDRVTLPSASSSAPIMARQRSNQSNYTSSSVVSTPQMQQQMQQQVQQQNKQICQTTPAPASSYGKQSTQSQVGTPSFPTASTPSSSQIQQQLNYAVQSIPAVQTSPGHQQMANQSLNNFSSSVAPNQFPVLPPNGYPARLDHPPVQRAPAQQQQQKMNTQAPTTQTYVASNPTQAQKIPNPLAHELLLPNSSTPAPTSLKKVRQGPATANMPTAQNVSHGNPLGQGNHTEGTGNRIQQAEMQRALQTREAMKRKDLSWMTQNQPEAKRQRLDTAATMHMLSGKRLPNPYVPATGSQESENTSPVQQPEPATSQLKPAVPQVIDLEGEEFDFPSDSEDYEDDIDAAKARSDVQIEELFGYMKQSTSDNPASKTSTPATSTPVVGSSRTTASPNPQGPSPVMTTVAQSASNDEDSGEFARDARQAHLAKLAKEQASATHQPATESVPSASTQAANPYQESADGSSQKTPQPVSGFPDNGLQGFWNRWQDAQGRGKEGDPTGCAGQHTDKTTETSTAVVADVPAGDDGLDDLFDSD